MGIVTGAPQYAPEVTVCFGADGSTAVPASSANPLPVTVGNNVSVQVGNASLGLALNTFTLNSAATTNATLLKSAPANIFSVTLTNTGAAAAFVKLYNTTVSPTVGTTVPTLTIPVAANGVVSFSAAVNSIVFGTGLALAVTNLGTDADATAVAAGQVKVVISYS